jgi:mannose-1-phosphate guanylyltransferase / phosphomannomutase
MTTLVILAGGKGTRLKSIQPNLHKCLTLIDGKPLIEHQLQLARRHGIEKFILLTGYYSDQIINYINNSQFKEQAIVVNEEQPMGTSGAFRSLEEFWKESILVFYGDVLCNFDIGRFLKFHNEKNSAGTLLVHPNDHPFDSDLIEINEDHLITSIHKKPHSKERNKMNLSNACAYLLKPELMQFIPKGASDWVHDVFPEVLNKGIPLYGYSSTEYLKDMGTPERLEQVRKDFASGKVKRGTYERSRGAIFIDRDGTINKEVDRCYREEDFELLPGVASAIKKINDSEYTAVIITNQPVIACGFCSIEELRKIHCKMDTLLSEEKAYIDALYFCPHHPDKGFPGEMLEYKIECNCRKPKIGLFEQAVEDHNIDLNNSVFIGDTSRDIETGNRAGVKTILVKTGYAGEDGKYQVEPDFIAADLTEAVEIFFKEMKI